MTLGPSDVSVWSFIPPCRDRGHVTGPLDRTSSHTTLLTPMVLLSWYVLEGVRVERRSRWEWFPPNVIGSGLRVTPPWTVTLNVSEFETGRILKGGTPSCTSSPTWTERARNVSGTLGSDLGSRKVLRCHTSYVPSSVQESEVGLEW